MARVPETRLPVESPARVVLHAKNIGLTAEQFSRLCHDNRDLRLELTARKEIVIMAPVHTRTGWQEGEIYRQLANWAEADSSGLAFGPNAGFTFPGGAVRAPDASWISLDRWKALGPAEQDSFAAIVPDFVIELRSRSDSPADLLDKMREYMDAGVRLAWLVDPIEQQVFVYRGHRPPGRIKKPDAVRADAVLPGFVLQLGRIWSVYY